MGSARRGAACRALLPGRGRDNGALEQRWRDGAAPFNGQTVLFASPDLTPLPALRFALLAVVSRLQQRWLASALCTLDDWHEHDGFVNEAKPASWQGISAALASESALFALSHGDSDVRRAFSPPTYDFYLRVYVPAEYDNDYPERRGDFDVTCALELADELADLAASASGLPVVRQDARGFFDRRYAG